MNPTENLNRCLDDLLLALQSPIADLSAGKRRVLREKVNKVIEQLAELGTLLDPIKVPESFFDPSDPRNVGRFIAETMLKQPRRSMIALERFYGSGLYAIYYAGDFDAYKPIAGTETPIYVGKANPAIKNASTPVEQGDKLHERLSQHRKTIESASNLKVSDFECRFLVVKGSWQNASEEFLIEHFQPVWNRVVNGFGKHGDSPATRANKVSVWDTLHSGRSWAVAEGNVPRGKDLESEIASIKARIAAHFTANPPVSC